ncbi:iron complex transport system substrate-binding protein [Peribacillus deserti]|uniref:Iron complex transport system substrate-binding protein n=1 Tax=Peribacillus deserti TaxID=673318 RepID=A0ABS2QMI4_9BACI|nr:ABC transporter substrate-binding protein [Peribacillus deserti]MBM7694387.1 iron complex transport system substrate-binding protein [Peribacillus deserti]
MKTNFTKGIGLLSILLILTLVVLTGCNNSNTEPKKEKTSEQTAKKEAFPITITDDEGKKVKIEKKPEKIVSVTPSNTEIAFALGLEDQIVGVSDFDNYPQEALKKEKVGAQELNIEKMLSLQPDLALLDTYHYKNHAEVIKQLKEAGTAVVIVNSTKNTFDQVYDSIELLGRATGTSKKAETIVKDMKDKLAEVKEKAAKVKEKKRVWVEVAPQPDIYTTGKGTFMQEMLDTIGAVNVAEGQQGWVKVNEEEAVKYNPDVVITTYGYYVKNSAQQVLSRKGWSAVPAVKNKQVFDVNSDTVTRPGPRLVEGVEALGKSIYPDIYK